MNELRGPINIAELVAVASSALERGGYRAVTAYTDWNQSTVRLFEDEYNVVGIAAYESSTELIRAWGDRQSSLVSILNARVGYSEGKAWDGYLVLVSGGIEDEALRRVRSDITRLRKIVATVSDLQSHGDIERILLPLLPLRLPPRRIEAESTLELLPQILERSGIPHTITRALVEAHSTQRSLMTALSRATETE